MAKENDGNCGSHGKRRVREVLRHGDGVQLPISEPRQ